MGLEFSWKFSKLVWLNYIFSRGRVLPENTDSDEILEDLKYLWELNDAEFGANERFQRLQQILDVNRYSISELMLKVNIQRNA